MKQLFEKLEYPANKPEKGGEYLTNNGCFTWHPEYGGAWYLHGFKESDSTVKWFMQPLTVEEDVKEIKKQVISIIRQRQHDAFADGCHNHELKECSDAIAIISKNIPPECFAALTPYIGEKWISVEDELPKSAKNVNGMLKFKGNVFYDENTRNWFNEEGKRILITHWQPKQ